MPTRQVETAQLTTTEAAVLALLAIEGERSGYDLLEARRAGDRARLVAGAERPLRRAAPARRATGWRAPHAGAVDAARQAALPHHARPGRAALDAWLATVEPGARETFFLKLFVGGADDARGAARARRAVRRRHRGAARASARDRADEHEPRARLVPPSPAPARDRAGRARARLGRRCCARAEARPAVRLRRRHPRRGARGVAAHARTPRRGSGTFRLPAAAEPVAIGRPARPRGHATVALGPGPRGPPRSCPRATGDGRLRFALPGGRRRPSTVGAPRRALTGSVRQGRCAARSRSTPGRLARAAGARPLPRGGRRRRSRSSRRGASRRGSSSCRPATSTGLNAR